MEAPENEKPAGVSRLPRRLLDWLRNWRLRSWRTALLGLWIAWLIVGFLVIPPVVRKLLIENLRKRAGLEATVRSVRFNPFSLSLTIEGLSIADRPGSVLFSADEIYANAELSSLFRWAATLSEFRMKNPVIGARRFADSKINLAEVVEEVQRRQPHHAGPPDPDLSLPRVLLQHIRVSGATIIVEDQAREKPLKMAIGPSVFVLSEISTIPERQGSKEIAIRLPGSGVVHVTGNVTVQPLGIEGDVRLEALHLKELWPLLEPYFRFTVTGGELTGRFHYTIAAADGVVRARVTDFENALKNLAVVNEGDRVLEVPVAAITKGSFRWPEAELVVERLRVERPSVLVGRDADGKMSYERMVPPPTRDVVVQTYQEIEKAARWTVEVGRFEVVDSRGRFVDRTFNPPVSLDAGDMQLAITGFTTRPGAFFGVVASASLPKGGTAKSSGRVSLKPVRFETDVALDGLDVTVAQPYLGRFLPFEILSGQAGSKGKVAGGVDPKKGLWAKFAGDLEARTMALRETVTGSTPLKWDAVQVRGVEAGFRPHGCRCQVGRRSRRGNRPGYLGERRSQPSRGQETAGRGPAAGFATGWRIAGSDSGAGAGSGASASAREPDSDPRRFDRPRRLFTRPDGSPAPATLHGDRRGHPGYGQRNLILIHKGSGAHRDRRGCARRRGGDNQGSNRSLPARPGDRPAARRAKGRDPAPLSLLDSLPRLSGHQGWHRPQPRLQGQRPTPEGQQSHRDPGPDARRQGRRRREGEPPDQAGRLAPDGQGRPHHARLSRRGPPRRPGVRDRQGARGGRFRAD